MVESNDLESVQCRDSFTGERVELSTEQLSHVSSATRFKEEIKVSLTDINERIENAGPLSFSVTWRLKPAVEDGKLTVGKERTLVGCLLTNRQTLGYWKVRDLTIITTGNDNIY